MASWEKPTSSAPTAPRDRTALPAERAFVVQLRADADLARGVVRGRVEHLTSGAAAVFESAEELVARMQEAMRSHGAPPPRPDPEATRRSSG